MNLMPTIILVHAGCYHIIISSDDGKNALLVA